MAFSQGVAQTVHITTLDGADPVAPTNPSVTVSLDGGATFEAPDNAAVTTAYGISLALSAAETARAAVLVRVTADNADSQVAAYYFEDAYTATRAGYLDAAISTRLPATWAAGVTLLKDWLGILAGKTADATTLAEVNATTAGATYANTTDSLEAIQAALPASGTGAFPITLYVKAGAVPIQGAKVRINATGGDCVLTTDSAGAVALSLDAGTYTAYVGTAASYTPSASYTVTISALGAVTAPTGGILTVTAAALPTPSDPDCYVLYGTETDEQDLAFGAAAVTVKVIELTAEGRVDATNNRFRSIMGRSDTTDASGQWSLDIPIQAFTAGAYITLRRTWTDAASVAQAEDWIAQLAAPSAGTSVCWSDLSPREV